MLSAISEEGLSPQAKALLKLLKWAEKEELAKELQNSKKLTPGFSNGERKDSTKRSQRANKGTSPIPAYAKKDS